MGSLGLWVRSEWRNGSRALIGLAVLVAFGGGITLAAFAGAHRSDTAFDRFLAHVSGVLDVSAAGIQGDLSVYDDAWSTLAPQVAALPGVDGVTPVSWMAVAFELNGRPSEFYSIANGPGGGSSPPPGAHVLEGRSAVAADEVTINEEAARLTGLGVGDRIVLRSYSPDQIDIFLGGDIEEDLGPTVDAEIVGIHRAADDISDNPHPFVILSADFHDAYADQIAHCDCSFAIAADHSDVAAVTAAIEGVVGDHPLAVHEINSDLRARVDRAVSLEVGALRIAAVVAALAAVLATAQALVRHISSGRSSAGALRAIGVTRSQIVRSWLLIIGPVGLLGALGAVLFAVVLSPLFPRGLALRAEIDPGVRVDTGTLLVGGVVVALTVVLLTAAAAGLSTRSPRTRAPHHARSWGSTFGPPATLGASFALDPSRDRSRVVAVSAIGGLALAITGVITVALIERSTADVLVTPSAFATDWDLELTAQPEDPDAVIGAVMAEPSVEGFALQFSVVGEQYVVTGPSATASVSPRTYEALVGSIGPILDSGRQPETTDDVVIGPAIADAIGAGVGDQVTVDAGLQGDQTFLVSGIGRISDGDETDRAFVVTPDGLNRIQDAEEFSIDGAFLRLGDADDGTRERLEALGFTAAQPPSRIANLDQIGTVPRLLAVALAALGLGGVIHGLLVARTRRRSDLAVARAIGFVPHQVTTTVRWQGLVITALASVVGVPLGLIVGRVVWKQVASGVGAVDLVSIPWNVMIIGPLVALGAVTVASSIIGYKAARLRPAAVLRSE